jgi:predicted Zn-dependent protease
MKNIGSKGLTLVLIFFFIWFSLSKVNWVEIFNVKQKSSKLEQKLGELYLDIFKDKEVKNTNANLAIDSLMTKIRTSNKIEEDIKIHIVNDKEVNAFALPDRHIVVFSGLIEASKNEEELSAVLCHELAHIELNHIMKKLISEFGLSVLVSMSTGGGNSTVIHESAKLLSSTAYDRTLEKDADHKAIDFLVKAKINPEPFADFLYKLSLSEPKGMEGLSWISTHPATKERAQYILKYSKNKLKKSEKVLAKGTWESMQKSLKEL